MDPRQEFLTKIYEQMFNDIDRHHKFVWETMGLLISGIAVLALAEKQIISIDIATAIIILLAAYVTTHVYDSNYWYNRNLVIIANIERQFLKPTDLKHIHHYFGEHRPSNKVQTSLLIQVYFCAAVVFIFLCYHFSKSIFPGFKMELTWENIRLEKGVPYLALLFGLLIVFRMKTKRAASYEDFLQKSPGLAIKTTETTYGGGHPTTSPISPAQPPSSTGGTPNQTTNQGSTGTA